MAAQETNEVIPYRARIFVERLTTFAVFALFATAVIGMAALLGKPHGRGWVILDSLFLCKLGFSLGVTSYIARLMQLPKSSIPWLLAGFGVLGCINVIFFQLLLGHTNKVGEYYTMIVTLVIPFQIVLRSLLKAAKPKHSDLTSS
jgi:hypothetical protein